jgi:hypothetical protein
MLMNAKAPASVTAVRRTSTERISEPTIGPSTSGVRSDEERTGRITTAPVSWNTSTHGTGVEDRTPARTHEVSLLRRFAGDVSWVSANVPLNAGSPSATCSRAFPAVSTCITPDMSRREIEGGRP